MLPVAILAGGLATRLYPITKTIPKALIEVSGKPFIFHQLSYLHNQGIRKVVLCIGYLGEQIKSLVGDGSKFELEISYSTDGSELLGTGGAIKKALPLLGDNFFILYGDTFLPIKFDVVENAYFSNDYKALMTILKNEGQWDKSNILFKSNILLKYNKKKPSKDMKYIDYGLSVVSAEIFTKYTNKTAFDISSIFESLSIKKQLKGFEVYERFYEIGTPNGLNDTEKYFSNIKLG